MCAATPLTSWRANLTTSRLSHFNTLPLLKSETCFGRAGSVSLIMNRSMKLNLGWKIRFHVETISGWKEYVQGILTKGVSVWVQADEHFQLCWMHPMGLPNTAFCWGERSAHMHIHQGQIFAPASHSCFSYLIHLCYHYSLLMGLLLTAIWQSSMFTWAARHPPKAVIACQIVNRMSGLRLRLVWPLLLRAEIRNYSITHHQVDSTNLNLEDLCDNPVNTERVMRHWQFTRSPLVYWTRKMADMATKDRWFNRSSAWRLDALLRSQDHIQHCLFLLTGQCKSCPWLRIPSMTSSEGRRLSTMDCLRKKWPLSASRVATQLTKNVVKIFSHPITISWVYS